MKLVKSFVINGVVVVDTGMLCMGHKVYTPEDDDNDVFYMVDSKGNVKCEVQISTDCSQNFSFVSDVTFKDIGK